MRAIAILGVSTMVKLMRMPDVLDAIGISKSTLYRMVAAGEFPAGVRIGERAIAWPSDEVQEFIRVRRAERGSRAAAAEVGRG